MKQKNKGKIVLGSIGLFSMVIGALMLFEGNFFGFIFLPAGGFYFAHIWVTKPQPNKKNRMGGNRK